MPAPDRRVDRRLAGEGSQHPGSKLLEPSSLVPRAAWRQNVSLRPRRVSLRAGLRPIGI